MKKLLLVLSLLPFAAVALLARPAQADTNFDASLQTGVAKRFFSSPSGAGGLPGSFGPVLLLEGDVALAPLLRVGLYVDEEWAIDAEPKAPFITSFGGRLKITPPNLSTETFRFWVFAGFGFAAVAAPAYHQTLPFPNENQSLSSVNADGTVPSATGSFFEIPFGVGASYKVRAPWVFLGELSGRAAFNCNGEYFDPGGRTSYQTSDPGNEVGVTIGSEAIAVFLTVGIGLEP